MVSHTQFSLRKTPRPDVRMFCVCLICQPQDRRQNSSNPRLRTRKPNTRLVRTSILPGTLEKQSNTRQQELGLACRGLANGVRNENGLS